MSDYARLGEAVRRERKRLYNTVTKAHQAAGVSRGAWDHVENGQPAREQTYTAIEKALGWRIGSCEDVLAGGVATTDDGTSADFVARVERSNLDDETRDYVLQLMRERAAGSSPESGGSSQAAGGL